MSVLPSRARGRASTRAFAVAGLLAVFLGAACGGVDSIEYQPDDENVQRVRPTWPEEGAKAPVPSFTVKDAGSDAAAPASDSGVDAAAEVDEDASVSDAGTDASADSGNPGS